MVRTDARGAPGPGLVPENAHDEVRRAPADLVGLRAVRRAESARAGRRQRRLSVSARATPAPRAPADPRSRPARAPAHGRWAARSSRNARDRRCWRRGGPRYPHLEAPGRSQSHQGGRLPHVASAPRGQRGATQARVAGRQGREAQEPFPAHEGTARSRSSSPAALQPGSFVPRSPSDEEASLGGNDRPPGRRELRRRPP